MLKTGLSLLVVRHDGFASQLAEHHGVHHGVAAQAVAAMDAAGDFARSVQARCASMKAMARWATRQP